MRPIAVLLVLAGTSAASAEIRSQTDITYFTVDGSTPAEIYHNILDLGPRVNGARAIAAIGTRATQDGGLDMQGGACRVTGYVITLDFAIKRPRIANQQVLPPAEQAMWQEMNVFIASHEDQHKTVWQTCAASLERSIDSLRAPSCGELGTRAEALWQEMLASCDQTQRDFDAEQSRALMKQPFMQRARQASP